MALANWEEWEGKRRGEERRGDFGLLREGFLGCSEGRGERGR
jgi:hypothetical protein